MLLYCQMIEYMIRVDISHMKTVHDACGDFQKCTRPFGNSLFEYLHKGRGNSPNEIVYTSVVEIACLNTVHDGPGNRHGHLVMDQKVVNFNSCCVQIALNIFHNLHNLAEPVFVLLTNT